MRHNLDWEPYFAAARSDKPYREKLADYAHIARKRLQSAEFEEFCATHLGHLDEIADDFFGSDAAKAAVRKKVEALYPKHEWDRFTELFFDRIQLWRRHESQDA